MELQIIVLLWIFQFGYHFGKLQCSEMIPLVLAPSGGTPEWPELDGVPQPGLGGILSMDGVPISQDQM